MTRSLAWWLVFGALAGPLHAQHRNPVGVGLRRPTPQCDDDAAAIRCGGNLWRIAVQAPAAGSAWPIAASAILPGSGQAMLAVNRALPYLTVEAFSWTAYAKHSIDYRRRRNGYRDLAATVARAAFTALRPHGDFAYYERMSHYPEAGRFDLVAGGGIDPETDTATYNGSVWLLARRTYFSDPDSRPDSASAEWARAIAFYKARAYDQLYRWSWTNAPVEYEAFKELIEESNDANRRALQDLGLIIANHVLSMVDAYITVRITRRGSVSGFGLEAAVPMSRFHLP